MNFAASGGIRRENRVPDGTGARGGRCLRSGVVMRERIHLVDQRAAYLEALENLLQARVGWINSAISPFARAAHGERPDAIVAPPQTERPQDFEDSRPALTG